LPGWAEAFLPHGRPPEVGERFAFPAAARALKAIAATRGAALYGGEIAAAAAAHSRAHGGAIEASDFASYQPEWVEPIGIDTYGHRLHEIPPNGQGIAALVALGILRHFDIEALPVDGAESQHLQIEAMKLAFADAYAHVADSRSMRLTPEEMLDDAYLAGRARLIDRKRAQVFGAGKPGEGRHDLSQRRRRARHDGELHPEQLHGLRRRRRRSRLGPVDAEPRSRLRPRPASPNCVAPGRRPFHTTIIPAFLTKGTAGRR